MKVLIVEDNDMLNTAYSFMMQSNGHEVISAFDGKQGLAKAADFKPDVILLDYLMPELDGLGFLKSYRAPAKHPDVKIILLTNLSQEDKIDEAMSYGVNKYLLKAQTQPHELVAAVNTL